MIKKGLIILLSIFFVSCNMDEVRNDLRKDKSTSKAEIDRGSYSLDIKSNNKESLIKLKSNYHVESIYNIGNAWYAQLFFKTQANQVLAKEILSEDNSILELEDGVYYQAFTLPNDPMYASYQDGLGVNNLDSIWDTYDGSGVKVAIIDSGVNNLHEDFSGTSAFATGYNSVSDQAISVDSNSDNVGHGSHVAGIIGARRNNNKGIIGTAPGCTLIPIKADSGLGFASGDLAEGIAKAVELGADIINLSLGGGSASIVVADAISNAISNNVVVVASMGNDGVNRSNYPAVYPGVIAVGATRLINGIHHTADFSTSGSHISITAPGEDIWSLDYNNNTGYLSMDGTSMSAPFVTGIVALLLQKYPSLTPFQVKNMLESTADDIENPGFDDKTGYGVVNPSNLLNASVSTAVNNKIKLTISAGGSLLSNQQVFLFNENGQTYLKSVLSNNSGIAVFTGVDPGKYIVKSMLYGSSYNSGVVTLIAGNDLILTHNYSAPTIYYIQTTSISGKVRIDHILLEVDSVNGPYYSSDGNLDPAYFNIGGNTNISTSKYSYYTFKAFPGQKINFVLMPIHQNSETGWYGIKVSTVPGVSSSLTGIVNPIDPENESGFEEGRSLALDIFSYGQLTKVYSNPSNDDLDMYEFTAP